MSKRLGFLDVNSEDGIFRGVILVTDTISVPMEVRWANQIEPTPAHRLIYGKTLNRYISIDCLAIPLLTNLQKKPELILICRDCLLDLRLYTETPVLLINKDEHAQGSVGSNQSEIGTSPDVPGPRITVHRKFVEDLVHVPDLQKLFSFFDPREVFSRLPIFLKAQER